MLIEIKGYVKPTKHQLEVDMEYDDKNENVVNPNGNINDVYGNIPLVIDDYL